MTFPKTFKGLWQHGEENQANQNPMQTPERAICYFLSKFSCRGLISSKRINMIPGLLPSVHLIECFSNSFIICAKRRCFWVQEVQMYRLFCNWNLMGQRGFFTSRLRAPAFETFPSSVIMMTLRNLIADGTGWQRRSNNYVNWIQSTNQKVANNAYMGCQRVKRGDSLESVLPPWHHEHASRATFLLLFPQFFP